MSGGGVAARAGSLRARLGGQPWLLAAALMLLGLIVTAIFQPDFFMPRNLGNTLRAYLPLMCIALAQTVIVIGGGIDLSLGAMLTLASVVMVRYFGDALPQDIGLGATLVGLLLGVGVALLAGLINGLCVAYLRLQPIIATFATNFLWSGLALWVLPQPGGVVPQSLVDAVRLWFGLPFAAWIIVLLLLGWLAFMRTRAAVALYASGGQPAAAFASGVTVPRVRLLAYAAGGLLTGLGALFLIGDISTGDPLIGGPLTLTSVVAVVIGGTRLSGGAGGAIGTLLGVVVLDLLRRLVFFMGLDPQWQTFVNGLIIVLALSAPLLLGLLRRRA
ncbi:ABC transporter permease [Deinococcus sp.]|uniref:ABC transporter permease n=1 Tax=Deinococcus sp. TaxID=47478 RepID=UPI003CC6A6DF